MMFCDMEQWQGVVYPLLLTSLIYAGSLVSELLLLLQSWRENDGGCSFFNDIKSFVQTIPAWVLTGASNVSVWRNLVVVINCSPSLFDSVLKLHDMACINLTTVCISLVYHVIPISYRIFLM